MTTGNSAREKFTSHELDDEVDLYYMIARRYAPEFGRFMSVDPLGIYYPSLSPYTYGANNPINVIDPDGRLLIFIGGFHFNQGITTYTHNYNYWNQPTNSGTGFVQRIRGLFPNESARFLDGSSGGFFSGLANRNMDPVNRQIAGYLTGYEQAEEMIKSLAPEESIKIFSHSMGTAFARGFNQYPPDQLHVEWSLPIGYGWLKF